MRTYVMYNGELHEVIRRFLVDAREFSRDPVQWDMFYEIEKTEAAQPNGYFSVEAVDRSEFFILPSTIANRSREWILGVKVGKT